ncbi:MAG: ribbon-helix-helix domain-containing protein [Actinobacteria bacterium]|nr:ribbon-helix-helix domain-containing protein [Actinomycetota bacterium]
MTTPVPTRFSDEEIDLIDELVAHGVGDSRSAVIRRAVAHLADAVRRARVGAAIADSYRRRPQTTQDDELAMGNAIALTEAEPW